MKVQLDRDRRVSRVSNDASGFLAPPGPAPSSSGRGKRRWGHKALGVDGEHDGYDDLHVLVSAVGAVRDPDAFSPANLRHLCALRAAVTHVPGYVDVCEPDPAAVHVARDGHGKTPCKTPWSVLDAAAALRTSRLGPLLAGIDTIRAAGPPALEALAATCGDREAEGGAAGRALCVAGVGCDVSPCAAPVPRCTMNGVDVCTWLVKAKPTFEEIEVVGEVADGGAAGIDAAADGDACAALNVTAVRAGISAAAVLQAWANEDASLGMIGVPMDFLVDREFSHRAMEMKEKKDIPEVEVGRRLTWPRDAWAAGANVTRVVFQLRDAEVGPAAVDFARVAVNTVLAPKSTKRLAPTLDVTWRSWELYETMQDETLFGDLRYAIGSFVFVFAYIWLSTGHLFVAVAGLFCVLMSFPLAVSVYRTAFDIEWIGLLHFLGLFIILGIGADDVYVVIEFWRQARYDVVGAAAEAEVICDRFRGDGVMGALIGGGCVVQVPKRNWAVGDDFWRDDTRIREATRLAWTLRHSVSAMAATSLTTAAAFLSNVGSSIAPVQLFGLFMAVLVFFNFVLVCTVFPALLVLHERAIERWTFRRSCIDNGRHTLGRWRWRRGRGGRVDGSRGNDSDAVEFSRLAPADSDSSRILSDSGASEIKKAEKAEPLRRHVSGESLDELLDAPIELTDADAVMAETSVDDIDTSGTPSKDKAGLPGKLSVDGSGDGTGSATSVLEHFARKVRALLDGPLADFVIRWRYLVVFLTLLNFAIAAFLASRIKSPNEATQLFPSDYPQRRYQSVELQFAAGQELESIPLNFEFGAVPYTSISRRDPAQTHVGTAHFDPGFDIADPMSQTWMLHFCSTLSSIELAPRLRSGSLRCAMAAFNDWLRFGGKNESLPLHRDLFLSRLTEWLTASREIRSHEYSRAFYFGFNSTVPIAHYVYATSSKEWKLDLSGVRQEYQFWQEWFATEMSHAPPGVPTGFHSSHVWRYVETFDEIRNAASINLLASLVVAFFVLILSTRDLITSLLATACIASVVATVLGTMGLRGWSFGIIESICTTVLVGLAVDYTVHIANAYVNCEETDGNAAGSREARIRVALRRMGLSVTSGAVTTVGAASFLLRCEITFFGTFGEFMVVTLVAALVHALVVFPAMCACIGSQGGEGAATGGAKLQSKCKIGTDTDAAASSSGVVAGLWTQLVGPWRQRTREDGWMEMSITV